MQLLRQLKNGNFAHITGSEGVILPSYLRCSRDVNLRDRHCQKSWDKDLNICRMIAET